MKQNIHALLIDCQNGFVLNQNYTPNLPGGHMNLCVEGGQANMDNLASMFKKHHKKIKDIHATLDSHQTIHIATPVGWVDKDGNHPNPFTIISLDEVKAGTWRATKPSLQAKFEGYVAALAANGRYPLCIWPPHCIIGTEGHNVYQPLREALAEWELDFNVVDFVTKGSNPFTEHYSAVQADVIDHADPNTQLNMPLIKNISDDSVSYILIGGLALNFCVANTIIDTANNISADAVKKFVLLEDATSPVKGFEHLTDSFLTEMKSRGMQISDTKNFF
jgi:nicotinamidase/pyrazinamidase